MLLILQREGPVSVQAQTTDNTAPPAHFTTRDLGNREVLTIRQQSQGLSSVVPLNFATPSAIQTPTSPYTYFVNWSMNRSMDRSSPQADINSYSTSGTSPDLSGKGVSILSTKITGWRAMGDVQVKSKVDSEASHSDLSLHEILDGSTSQSRIGRSADGENPQGILVNPDLSREKLEDSQRDFLNFLVDPFQQSGPDQPNPDEQQLDAISKNGADGLLLEPNPHGQDSMDVCSHSSVPSRAESQQASDTLSTLEDINFALQLPSLVSPEDRKATGSAQNQGTVGTHITSVQEPSRIVLPHEQLSEQSSTDSLSFNLQPPAMNLLQPKHPDDPS